MRFILNKVPIITGGTGFYIQALLYDIDFKENDEKNPVREELEQLAEKLGENAPQVLHQKLQEVDPEAAAQIHANNIKRVIRAIEYFKQTGEKISQHNEEMHQKDSPIISYTMFSPGTAKFYTSALTGVWIL